MCSYFGLVQISNYNEERWLGKRIPIPFLQHSLIESKDHAKTSGSPISPLPVVSNLDLQ